MGYKEFFLVNVDFFIQVDVLIDNETGISLTNCNFTVSKLHP